MGCSASVTPTVIAADTNSIINDDDAASPTIVVTEQASDIVRSSTPLPQSRTFGLNSYQNGMNRPLASPKDGNILLLARRRRADNAPYPGVV